MSTSQTSPNKEQKLYGLMIMNGHTKTSIAEKLNITPITMTQKMKGRSDWTRLEIQLIIRELRLSFEEVNELFFDGEIL
jgi:DNA-binding XRE family transcriptional regulator